MFDAQSPKVFDCISKFTGIDDARTLYCNLLNYDYQDLPIPVEEWSKAAKEIVIDGKIIAKKSGFYILYFIIRKLTRTNERTVLQEILKRFPDCAVVFTDENESEFHITSPKYEPESRYKFVIRRYLVGKYEKLRTASERLCLTYAQDTDTATELKAKHDDAFNVEAVTKQFYNEYKAALNLMETKLLSQGIGDKKPFFQKESFTKETVYSYNKKTAKGFTQQFLNRLMFLYFIQKKGWLNKDERFVWSLVKRYKRVGGTPNGIYKDWIEPLFFYSFNNKEIPNSYDHLPADLRKIYERMPYLNGGLFLKNALDELGYQLDDTLIYKIVDIDGGLLERYNFTIREDTPFDIDVAVDPEMLGKVYESLIFEEERGEAGIFYTPRIEVDFMCRQSLLEYLIEHTGIAQDKLISFLYGTEEDRADLLPEEEAQQIGNALFRAKIVDPACGSGAFLVGMLHVLMELYRQILKRLNKSLNPFEIKKEIINNNLYGADIKDWAVRVAELRLWLTLLVETEEKEIQLDSGKPLLPNLTLKLRCGDSLVQEIGSKPLSLREYIIHLHPISKTGIMDSYKELREDKKKYYYSRADDPEVLARIKRKEVKIIRTLVDSEIKRIDFLLKPLAATQQRLGSAQTAIIASDKERAEERIKLEREKERLEGLLKTLESGVLKNRFFWEIDFAEIFADGGFDIVIANPPYVRQEKIAPQDIPEEEITKEIKKEYKEALVRSVKAQWGDEFKKDLKSDVYVYFYYHGLSLLKPGGVFCFISSNSWLDVGFGAKLQEFLLRNIEVKAIYDNHAKRSFEGASINTIIALFKRPADGTNLWDKRTKFVAFKKPFKEVITEDNLKTIVDKEEKLNTEYFRCITMTQGGLWKEGVEVEETKQSEIAGSEFIGKYAGNKWGGKYLRAPDIFFTILEKGKGKLVRLGDIADVRRGFTTGANEFFYLRILGKGSKEGLVRVRNEAGWEGELEEEFLVPIIKSPREVTSISVKPDDLKWNALMCNKSKNDLRGTHVLDYIAWGEQQNYYKRPTCASRQKWWDLGVKQIGQFIWFKAFNDRFLVPQTNNMLNSDRFYTIKFNDIDRFRLNSLSLALNNVISHLFTELNGRVNLGEGALDNMTYEAARIHIINPKLIEVNSLPFIYREIYPCLKEINQPDRCNFDELIFDILNLTEEEREDVYRAVLDLVKSRLEKARSV